VEKSFFCRSETNSLRYRSFSFPKGWIFFDISPVSVKLFGWLTIFMWTVLMSRRQFSFFVSTTRLWPNVLPPCWSPITFPPSSYRQVLAASSNIRSQKKSREVFNHKIQIHRTNFWMQRGEIWRWVVEASCGNRGKEGSLIDVLTWKRWSSPWVWWRKWSIQSSFRLQF
jgi:hypothetical protein